MSKQIAETMSEDDLMDHVRTICRQLKLLAYHTYDSRKSPPGYPDWHIVGRNGAIFRECKTETGKTTAEQDEWLDALRGIGQDADVWRPSDLISGRIQRELAALARRNLERRANA